MKTACGLAGIGDVVENRLDDRMESFALSETLKYLYLLFDEDNPLASSDSNILFTTEGHILTLNSTHLRPMSKFRRETRKVCCHIPVLCYLILCHIKHENLMCPSYQTAGEEETHHLRTMPFGIRNRPDYDFARTLVGFDMESAAAKQDLAFLEPGGVCEVPKIKVHVRRTLFVPRWRLILCSVIRIFAFTNRICENRRRHGYRFSQEKTGSLERWSFSYGGDGSKDPR